MNADELVDYLEKCENELLELSSAGDLTEELNRKKQTEKNSPLLSSCLIKQGSWE